METEYGHNLVVLAPKKIQKFINWIVSRKPVIQFHVLKNKIREKIWNGLNL